MIKPSFPLICISKENFLDLIPEENFFSKVVTSALVDKEVFKDTILFDSNGWKWTYEQVSDKFTNNLIARLLAKTFYNPLVDAKVIWTNEGNYDIQQLKDRLNLCIDKDDDIITQFEDGDIIKEEITKAYNFPDILNILNRYIFEVNEEQLNKKTS